MSRGLKYAMKQPWAMTSLVLGSLAHGALGCLLALIGAVSPEWMVVDNDVKAGLIVACNVDCSVYSAEGSIALSRMFAALAFFCVVAGLIINLFYYFKFFHKDIVHRALPLISAMFLFISACLDLAVVIMIATKGLEMAEIALNRPVNLGSSSTLTVVAALFCLFSGILSVLHRSGLPN